MSCTRAIAARQPRSAPGKSSQQSVAKRGERLRLQSETGNIAKCRELPAPGYCGRAHLSRVDADSLQFQPEVKAIT